MLPVHEALETVERVASHPHTSKMLSKPGVVQKLEKISKASIKCRDVTSITKYVVTTAVQPLPL